MRKYCGVDLEHYSYVGLVELNFLGNQHLVDFPAFLKFAPDSEAIDNCGINWKIGLNSFFHHFLQYLIGHFRSIVLDIGLHERSIEKLAVSEP